MHTSTFLRLRLVAALSVAVLCLAALPAAAQQPSGPDVWAANCGSCHRIRAVDAYTASQWNTIATHMGLVARLTPAETRAVREFLVGSAGGRQAATPRRPAPDQPRAGKEGVGGAAKLDQQQARAANAPLVAGREIYRGRCAACHGPQGRGNGPAAAAMNPRPTDFANPGQRTTTSDFAVGEVVEHGRRGMPAFGRMLTRVQIDSVVAYVRSLQL
jgi:mono/diheme cytochrome c family protein